MQECKKLLLFQPWIVENCVNLGIVLGEDRNIILSCGGCLHKCNQEGDQGGPWTPLEGAKWHQKVQRLILEGAKIKYFERLNTSLEGAELFGPPKIRGQLRLWLQQSSENVVFTGN